MAQHQTPQQMPWQVHQLMHQGMPQQPLQEMPWQTPDRHPDRFSDRCANRNHDRCQTDTQERPWQMHWQTDRQLVWATHSSSTAGNAIILKACMQTYDIVCITIIMGYLTVSIWIFTVKCHNYTTYQNATHTIRMLKTSACHLCITQWCTPCIRTAPVH